jgi:hypothetical protein
VPERFLDGKAASNPAFSPFGDVRAYHLRIATHPVLCTRLCIREQSAVLNTTSCQRKTHLIHLIHHNPAVSRSSMSLIAAVQGGRNCIGLRFAKAEAKVRRPGCSAPNCCCIGS